MSDNTPDDVIEFDALTGKYTSRPFTDEERADNQLREQAPITPSPPNA